MTDPIPPMVERVAQAMLSAASKMETGQIACPWQMQREDTRGQFAALARAAIEAMREPTAEMSVAAMRDQYPGDRASPSEYWAVMIDTALGKGKA